MRKNLPEKKIFIFSSVHRWNDTRIFYKEATSLAKKYEVELHAPAKFTFKKINNVKIFGLPLWEKVADRIKIRKELWKRIRRSDSDIFHFHDPELIWIGIKIKLLKRKKVIYDVHENYSETIKTKYWIPKYFRYLIYLAYRLLERLGELIFDELILVLDEHNKLFRKKCVVVKNYPVVSNIVRDEKKPYDVIYLGGIERIRGVFEMLKAAEILSKKYHDFKMEFVGPVTEDVSKEIDSFIKDRSLLQNIFMAGRLDYPKALLELGKAKIGLVTLLPQKNYFTSIATKMFEYMMYEIPVIASDFYLWKKIIENNNCGICVNPEEPKEIADAIERLIKRTDISKQMGLNGYNAVLKKYNWANEEKKLFQLFCDIG